MKLLRLKANMFKGIRSLEIRPSGNSINIYGENGSCKTSIADAITFLLFDKDTQDKSPANFGIKTVDESGEPLHGQEHSVEGQFELETGEYITLRKVYSEKWTKKRGNSESELTNHKTDHYWDDEPVAKNDYKERIEEIMPEQLFKMLTLPSYFAEQMHWKGRRDILTQLCGDIKDDDIIADDQNLAGYTDLLDGKTQEARVKILRERKKKLSDEIDNIPSRIDENNQKIVEPDQSAADAQKKIENLQEKVEGCREKLSQAQSGGGVSELQVKVQEIEAEKAKARNEHQKKVEESLTGARKKVDEIQNRYDQIDEEVRDIRREYQNKESDLELAKQLVAEMEVKIETERNRKPEPKPDNEGPRVCPMCDQEIPQKNEADHYEKYVAEFNAKKADNIKSLSSELALLKGKAEQALTDLEEVEQRGLKANGRLSQVEQALDKAKADLKDKKNSQPEFDSEEFEQKQKAIEAKIDEIRLSKQDQIRRIKDEITTLESKIEEHRKVVRQHEFNAELRKRNQELQDQLKRYGQELDDVEQGLYLIEDFNRAKAGYITDRVNEMFSIVTWRLFKEQVNGGMTEVCDPVVGGVPFSEGLNNARRVQAGIDIIKTLSQFYGKTAPVFVDNRESVTKLPETDLQIISLIVSPEDKKLRVEPVKELAVA